MSKKLRDLLDSWEQIVIKDSELAALLNTTDDSRYGIVKRALKSEELLRLRKGLYLISHKTKTALPHEFQLALAIYGPSFVSLESALAYHNWIPEAVYTVTCVSPKRAREFATPLGVFSYKRVPAQGFYLGVDRTTAAQSFLLIASPWRALADMLYTRRAVYSLEQLEGDMRIDRETILASDLRLLDLLSKQYPSQRVRKNLKKLYLQITKMRTL
jgi:predicted transcriptional regulator of viral defense system